MPVHPEITVITPEVARQMVAEYDAGTRPAFSLFAVSEQTAISVGEWLKDVLRWANQKSAQTDYFEEEVQ